MGAMVFGRVPEERIQLNEESIWAGGPWPEHKENLAPVLAQARRLLFEGKVEEAQNLIGKDFMAEGEGQHHPDVLLLLPAQGPREQQPRDIGTGDEKDQPHGDEKSDQHRLNPAEELIPDRNDDGVPPPIGFGILDGQPTHHL